LTLTVVGTRGTARFEHHACRWRLMHAPGNDWHDAPGRVMERDALYIAQAEAFLDALDGDSPVPCTLNEGEQTLRVNLAALESAETGAWQAVRVPPPTATVPVTSPQPST